MGDIIPALQKGKLKPCKVGYVTSIVQMMSGGSMILPQAYQTPNLHSISRLTPKRNSRRDYVFGTVKGSSQESQMDPDPFYEDRAPFHRTKLAL